MEKIIIDKIKSANNFKEAERFAEELTYNISFAHKKNEWRTRYEYLRYEDFVELGWKVLCVGVKGNDVKKWLIENGYKQHRKDKIYFNAEKKELFMVGDYAGGESVSIDNYVGEPYIFTLDEYKQLLINKLLILLEKRKSLQIFIDEMIIGHKAFLTEQANEEIKQRIIEDAIEKAKKDKLII